MTSNPDLPPFDYAKTTVNAHPPIHVARQSVMSPQAADLRIEKTTNPRSPDIQEINEDFRQTHKIYQFQNCGIVYMDSLNARGVRMENCDNNVPQVTYHRPRIISDEKVPHSQSHAVSNGPQNATGPPTTAPTEIVKSNHSNVHLQTNALSLPQSPQPISSSHSSGDHTQTSTSTKPRGSEIPTRSFSDIGNDGLYSSLAVHQTGRIHLYMSISLDYVMFFSWLGLAAVSCLAVFSICYGSAKGSS